MYIVKLPVGKFRKKEVNVKWTTVTVEVDSPDQMHTGKQTVVRICVSDFFSARVF